MEKKSFILYNDQKEVIDELDDEQAGKIFKAIYEYNSTKKINLKGALKVIFIPFKTSFDRDDEKWENIRKVRAEAGKKHKGNQYTKGKKMEQMEQDGTNGSVSVSVSDSVSVNVSDSVCVINNTLIPDTHDTVFQFCLSEFSDFNEKDLEKSCKKFFAYYHEKNWQGVKDWREKAKMWMEDDIDGGKIKKVRKKKVEVIDGITYENGKRVL